MFGQEASTQMTTTRPRDFRRRTLPVALLLPLLAGACSTLSPIGDRSGLAPDQSANLLRLARTAENRGDPRTAAALYQQAHALDPSALEPLLALGNALRAQRSYAEAASAFRQAIGMVPSSAEALRGLGLCQIAVDQPDEALNNFNRVLELDTADARAWNGRGVALDMMGRHVEAQQSYRSGLATSPDDVALRNNLGLSLAISGDYEAAIAVLEPITRVGGAAARSRQNLALAYGLAGRPADAAKVGQIDLDPEQVRNNLSYYEAIRASIARPEPERAAGGWTVVQAAELR